MKPGKTDFYNALHYAAVTNDAVLLPFEKRFVAKVIDEVIENGNDHVLFQVDDESGIGDASLEPDPYWARFAREYAASKGIEIFVCTSRRFRRLTPYAATTFQDWDNPEVRVSLINPAFNFKDISQNNGTSGQQHYDNLLWYRSKVRPARRAAHQSREVLPFRLADRSEFWKGPDVAQRRRGRRQVLAGGVRRCGKHPVSPAHADSARRFAGRIWAGSEGAKTSPQYAGIRHRS